MRARTLDLRRWVFVDTSAYFALTDPRDIEHMAARRIFTHLTAERWWAYTTNFVLAETHALILNRINRATAARVLFELDASPATRIVRVRPDDERRAREIIATYDDKDFSLVDATSFAVMDRLGIRHAFSLDRHFAQYGFILAGSDPAR